MCLYPRIVKNPKYRANKKNGGNIPPVTDERKLYVPIGCQQCFECKKQKATAWRVRINEEIKENKNGKFVTLTLSDNSIKELHRAIKDNEKRFERIIDENGLNGYNLDNEIASIAIRRFLERWRKKHGKSVRHWLITEIGGNRTERIHIHGIIWTDENENEILERWKYGRIHIGKYVNEETSGYIVKYLHKQDEKHKIYESKIFTSAGIGKEYTNSITAKKHKFKKGETIEYYRDQYGVKYGLPIYYKNKLFTEEERDQLWTEKLDNKKRYIFGKEIDISNGEETYYSSLKEAQAKNKRMGYGDGEINWTKRTYENQKRLLKYKKRWKA